MICIRLAVGEQVSNYVARQTRHRRIRPDQLLLLSLPMAITVCDATAHRFRAAFNAIASAMLSEFRFHTSLLFRLHTIMHDNYNPPVEPVTILHGMHHCCTTDNKYIKYYSILL